jgi:hypothetical protein
VHQTIPAATYQAGIIWCELDTRDGFGVLLQVAWDLPDWLAPCVHSFALAAVQAALALLSSNHQHPVVVAEVYIIYFGPLVDVDRLLGL